MESFRDENTSRALTEGGIQAVSACPGLREVPEKTAWEAGSVRAELYSPPRREVCGRGMGNRHPREHVNPHGQMDFLTYLDK